MVGRTSLIMPLDVYSRVTLGYSRVTLDVQKEAIVRDMFSYGVRRARQRKKPRGKRLRMRYKRVVLACPRGLEPPISGSAGQRSIH
jgi:hypothetical protein